jgi:predicted RNA-binding protein (virulence factor B family)
MINIGQSYPLEVLKIVDLGAFLDAGPLGEVLLPSRHMPENLQVGDSVFVFLYLDSEDRPIATTQTPKAKVGEFAYLKVSDTNQVGAFLDWGLEKDVLVPFPEQHRPMETGRSYLVYLYIDRVHGRITASSKIDKFLDKTKADFKPRQCVDLIIANSTELGYKAIVNHSHWGVLYKNEVFQRLSFGQSTKGYIKRVRDDQKIDLTLQGGKEVRDQYAERIERYLQQNEGFAALNDKSDPELISQLLSMSKKSFKKAIGGLFKQRIISIDDDGIRLVKK